MFDIRLRMGQLTTFISDYHQQLFSVALVVFATLVARVTRLRPRLQHSVKHAADLLVDEPLLAQDGTQIAQRQIVRMASIVVTNAGLQHATGAEVTFNWKPMILNVLPARSFTGSESTFDRYTVRFDSLSPGEQVTLDLMSINANLPPMTSVRCDECESKPINMTSQRVWPGWFYIWAKVVFFIGAATVIYLLIRFISFVLS